MTVAKKLHQPWFDRALATVAPGWALQRTRARVAQTLMLRHYEAASVGRRTENWNRSNTDANAAQGGQTLAYLRTVARDLVRNNPYAEAALATICDHTVGWGIVAKPNPTHQAVAQAWNRWAESTDCDADGRHTLAGLQKLVLKTVVRDGECIVRRRVRRLEDGWPIPLQLQVIEPDLIDTSKSQMLPNGGRIIQGVEFGPLGNREAYWLYPEHPGASLSTNASSTFSPSRRIPASDVQHVFKGERPGQVRAASWYAPVLLKLKDFDEYEDATLMKQKIAACLAVITSDPDGQGTALGTADDTDNPGTDTISPGAILNVPSGRTVDVVEPPTVGEYKDFTVAVLRAIATGLHVTYEDLTGDFSQVNFSSSRMARLKHWARVEDWRWRLLIPQFCDPVWGWAMDAMQLMGAIDGGARPVAEWSAPPMPMIEPNSEILAGQRAVRNGGLSWGEWVRQQGYDPERRLEEIKEWNRKLDDAGVVLDCDPRYITQAGQVQSTPTEPASAGGAA